MITQQQINYAPIYFSDVILGELYGNGITCWIAGGSVRDYFMGINPVDIDIFFPNENEFNKAKMFFESRNAEKKWESENGVKYLYNGDTFDLVKIYHSSPQKTIKYFDFTTAMFAVTDKSVFAGDTSFDDLDKRKLVINSVTFPDSTLKRVIRYYGKGFTMSSKQLEKLAKIIKKMPLKIGNDDFLNFASSGDTTPPDTSTTTETIITTIPIIKDIITPKVIKETKSYLPYILMGAGLFFIIFSKKEK
jgi:hypothetical protein